MFNTIKLLLGKIKNRNVIYGASFFTEDWFKNWEELKVILGELIVLLPQCKSVLDFGCGPGVMIDYMNKQGIIYVGCDYSVEAHGLYTENFNENPEKYVKNLPEQSDFDYLLSFDVLEHMSDHEIVALINSTEKIENYFFNISRDKHVPGHINIKNDVAWIDFFAHNGLYYNLEVTSTLRTRYSTIRPSNADLWNKNMFILSRKSNNKKNS